MRLVYHYIMMVTCTQGSQYNHGVWSGAIARTVAGKWALDSLDAPIMLPMTSGYPFGANN
jgi:hypothetical protein